MRRGTTDHVQIPSREQVKDERRRLKQVKLWRKVVLNTIGILIVVAASAVLIVSLLFSVLQVVGTSMEPTLEDGDVVVLVNQTEFQTGQLVGIRHEGKVLLKRVIGGPGDVVFIEEDGTVSVNDEKLDEPYVTEAAKGECDISFPYQVPDNSYFVLGDHRSVSIDSRSDRVGCVRSEQIIGKVVFCIWPFPRIGQVH